MKNILITGGAGFIGSHLVKFFVKKYSNYSVSKVFLINLVAKHKNMVKENKILMIEARESLKGNWD